MTNLHQKLYMKIFSGICACLLYSLAVHAQPVVVKLTPLLRQRLDSIAVQDVPPFAPGIATGIVSRGSVVYRKVAGWANLEDSTLITGASRFNIASNGKQFTALAILLLESEQKLRITDDIRKYLPTLYPGIASPITIANLLSHTSGIRDVYDLWSLQGITWWKNTFSNKDVFAMIEKQRDLNFSPGSGYLYSNTNYILLAEMVEKISRKPFVVFTREMFQRLGMNSTSFESDYTRIKGPVAKAYFSFDKWTTYDWIWNVYGDGNIFSTLDDQLLWEQILQGKSIPGIQRSILNKTQEWIAGSSTKRYGYGLEFGVYKGLPYRFHEGATGAWKATVTRFPGKQVSILTLTNTGKSTPDRQTRQMADVIFELKADDRYFPVRPSAAGNYTSDEDIAGVYQTDNNFTFQFELRDSVMYLKRYGRSDIKLEREAANIFHQATDTAFKQEFKRNERGEMEVTAYYTSHAPYSLTKINANWSGYDASQITGVYVNQETGVAVDITYLAGKEYVVKIGSKNPATGLLLSPGKLLVGGYALDFDHPGQAKNFLLSGGRIQRVNFIKKSN